MSKVTLYRCGPYMLEMWTQYFPVHPAMHFRNLDNAKAYCEGLAKAYAAWAVEWHRKYHRWIGQDDLDMGTVNIAWNGAVCEVVFTSQFGGAPQLLGGMSYEVVESSEDEIHTH